MLKCSRQSNKYQLKYTRWNHIYLFFTVNKKHNCKCLMIWFTFFRDKNLNEMSHYAAVFNVDSNLKRIIMRLYYGDYCTVSCVFFFYNFIVSEQKMWFRSNEKIQIPLFWTTCFYSYLCTEFIGFIFSYLQINKFCNVSFSNCHGNRIVHFSLWPYLCTTLQKPFRIFWN